MNIYIVDIGIIVASVLLLLLVIWELQRWVQRRFHISDSSSASEPLPVARTIFVLNLATSVLVAVPIVAAVVSLLQNRPQQALNFNIASLALLIVTKGGLFLFAVIKGVPLWLATRYVGEKVYARIRPKKKQPTTPEQRHE